MDGAMMGVGDMVAVFRKIERGRESSRDSVHLALERQEWSRQGVWTFTRRYANEDPTPIAED